MILKEIQDPTFLKTLSKRELLTLCAELRKGIIESVSEHGGHLSSNLGVVELTVALHRSFDFAHDRLLFDVGHQCYPHKILTGRYDGLRSSLRQWHGTSGYQQRKESLYDHFEAGHAGTALSAAMGMALARNDPTEHVVAVVGDSSMANGMSMEALNHLSHLKAKVIVVYNDNGMGISTPIGGTYRFFSKARSSLSYQSSKYVIRQFLLSHWLTKPLYYVLHYSKEFWRRLTIGTNLFENMGLFYLGPVNGHDLQGLENIFSVAKMLKKSVVVHVMTTKGKGYPLAENDPHGYWHGVEPFHIDSGEPKNPTNPAEKSWSAVFSQTVDTLMNTQPLIDIITPAMATGSKLEELFQKYPQRSYDVGIAESHAVTLAAGLALSGRRPFVSIYSTFLQRAYDQVIHDNARMNLPVTYLVDRCGIVGNDGETHQGIFDVAYIRPIPNTIICMPADQSEVEPLLELALQSQKDSYFVRMPRGKINLGLSLHTANLQVGQWSWYPTESARLTVIVTGPTIHDVRRWQAVHHIPIHIAFARFYKPFDESVLAMIQEAHLPVVVVDVYSVKEGLFEPLVAYFAQHHFAPTIHGITIPSAFIEHGAVHDVYRAYSINFEAIAAKILQIMNDHAA